MIRYTFLLVLIFFACSDDDNIVTISSGSSFCKAEELQIVSDGESCDIESNFLICEIIEIEELQFIDQDAYEWSPDICDLEPGEQLAFKNQGNTTFFNVVENGHYIAEERINVSCNENYEHTTYICQKNEIIYVSFLNDLLGDDTLSLELRTMIISYEDQTPGEKQNIINLRHDRSNSNIVNFWLRHFIDDEYYDGNWQSFHEEITLNGEVYNDVVKYEYGEHIHAEPDFRYYLQKGRGILGFEVNGKLWLRD